MFTAYCLSYDVELETACDELTSDDSLYSMFRMEPKPITCPFSGMPFSFSYNRGHGDCKALENQAESCTDESKLLLKYQACADIQGAESSSQYTFLFCFRYLSTAAFLTKYDNSSFRTSAWKSLQL